MTRDVEPKNLFSKVVKEIVVYRGSWQEISALDEIVPFINNNPFSGTIGILIYGAASYALFLTPFLIVGALTVSFPLIGYLAFNVAWYLCKNPEFSLKNILWGIPKRIIIEHAFIPIMLLAATATPFEVVGKALWSKAVSVFKGSEDNTRRGASEPLPRNSGQETEALHETIGSDENDRKMTLSSTEPPPELENTARAKRP